jgi:type I restriction enzyme S subunit
MREHLPNGWTTKKSSDFCLRVADGTHDTPKPVQEGRPLITSKNLKGGCVNYNDAYMISEADYQQINKRSKVDRWDVLFSMIGTVGEIALIRAEPEFAIKNIGLFKSRTKEDGVWLYYYLSSSIGQAALDTYLSGTSQQFVALGDLRKVPVIVPTNKSKGNITAILSAYDELIENNQRCIAVLEKLAEEIYREWFVRLRFPGHEMVKVVKGVPSGWEVRTLGSFASEIKQGVKKKALADDERYIGLEHIPRRSIALKEWATADSVESDKLLFQERDILFGKIRPYLHKVALAHFSGACSSDTIVIRPKEKCYEGYLLFTVFSDTFIELATIASKGTKMPRADWGFLKKLELPVPDKKVLEIYQAQFEAMFSQIVNLLQVNELLTHSCNMLLPRFMSGKLSVENVDIRFPSGMAEELEAIE